MPETDESSDPSLLVPPGATPCPWCHEAVEGTHPPNGCTAADYAATARTLDATFIPSPTDLFRLSQIDPDVAVPMAVAMILEDLRQNPARPSTIYERLVVVTAVATRFRGARWHTCFGGNLGARHPETLTRLTVSAPRHYPLW